MARKIRVKETLTLNGVEIRDIDVMRENFDIDAVIDYAFNGKLEKWLRDRYYEEEADAVAELAENDPDLEDKLYEIFDVDRPLTEEEIAWREEHLAILKQYTDDEEILANVESVAFDQQDLSDLLDEGLDEIYLCNARFLIPLRVKDKTYIGIGDDAVAEIRSNTPIDFEALNIHFKNIRFNSAYQKIAIQVDDGEPADSLFERGLAAEKAKDYAGARNCFERAAVKNHKEAMKHLISIYLDGKGMKPSPEKAFKWLLKLAESKDKTSMNKVAEMFEKGIGVKKDIEKALYWYRESAKIVEEVPRVEQPAPSAAPQPQAKPQPQPQAPPPPPVEEVPPQPEPVVEESKPASAVHHNEITVDGYTARVTTQVINKTGVHSHPAYNFVQIAAKFKSKIQILAKGRKCDGKSILMVMSLGLAYGTELTIVADGPDAEEAVRTLRDLVDDGFGEE